MQRDELIQNLIDRILEQQATLERIAKALERSARANDDAAGTVAALLPEIRTAMTANTAELAALKALLPAIQAAAVEQGKAAAVLADNFKDVQREITGAHPRQELEVDDTDKAIGKIVRGAFRHGWVRAVALLGGGGGIGAAAHWFIDHILKR